MLWNVNILPSIHARHRNREWPVSCFHSLGGYSSCFKRFLLFLDFPGILDTEDGYRISQVRAVEIENLIISSGVSISPDSQPVKKSAVWNPYSFFTGSPPIRATLDGHLGCWKASTHQRMAHKGFRKFVFIRDKWPGNLSDKRPASSDIATVSSDNYAATCNLFPKQIVPSWFLRLLSHNWFRIWTQSASKKSKSVPVAPLTSSDCSSSHDENDEEKENDGSDDEDRLQLMVKFHFFVSLSVSASLTQWVARFVSLSHWVARFFVFSRSHLFSGLAHTNSRPRPRTREVLSKSHFAMATIFFFFSISTTSSRGLTALNRFAISHLFDCWSTHSWDIKSSLSVCTFRRWAAATSWK